jgi:hypothetical protein
MTAALVLTDTARARRKAAFGAVSSDVVNDFLAAAEAWVHSCCDRKFVASNYSVTYNGTGGRRLYVKNRPINSLVSCSIVDDGGAVETVNVSTDLTYESEAGAVEFGPDNASSYDIWPRGFQNINLTYNAGYAAIPDDVQEAVILRALVLYAASGSDMNAALGGQTVGEGRKDRITPAVVDGWQKQAESLLAPYRRLEVAS